MFDLIKIVFLITCHNQNRIWQRIMVIRKRVNKFIDDWVKFLYDSFASYFKSSTCIDIDIDDLKSFYGNEAASYSTAKNWFNEFNCGRRSLKDEVRVGLPQTVLLPENINAVRELIMQDRSKGPAVKKIYTQNLLSTIILKNIKLSNAQWFVTQNVWK